MAGGVLLQEPFGARPYALGQAYAALGDDVFAAAYNPAAISRLKDSQAATEFTRSIVDTQLGYAAVATPLNATSALGLSAAYLDAGKLNVFDGDGRQTGSANFEQDFVAALDFARVISVPGRGALHVGVSPKVLRSTLGGEFKSTAYSMDAGSLYEIPWREGTASAAVVVANAGPTMRYAGGSADGTAIPLPLTARVAAGYRRGILDSDAVSAGLEMDRIFHDDSWLRGIGVEYDYRRTLALRLGYWSGEADGGIRLGVGFRWKDLEADYAMGLMSTFNNVSHFSLTYHFMVPRINYGRSSPLDVRMRRIRSNLEEKRYFDAADEITRLRGVFPDSSAVSRYEAQVRGDMGVARDRGSGSASFNYASALLAYQQGQWEDAVEFLEANARQDPDNDEVKRWLVKIKERIAQRQRQIQLQQQARTGTLFEIANKAFEEGDGQRAQRILQEILRTGAYQPAQSLLKKIEASVRTQPARPPVVERVRVTAQEQARAEALYYQALREYADDDLEKAVADMTRACQLDPGNNAFRNPLERIKNELEQRRRNRILP